MAAQQDACTQSHGVPSCNTGPVGRWRFVTTELRDVWGELRSRGKPSLTPAAGAGSATPDPAASVTEKGA